MKQSEIARVCHEVNKAYCEALGDNSQPPWKEAPEWQVDSAVKGVAFHTQDPNADPEHSHECWLEEKKAAGWVYGDVKDADKKTHPCILPFRDLPGEQKAKDFIFRAIVHALL